MILSLLRGSAAATFNISAAHCLTSLSPDQQWALSADLLIAIYEASGRFGSMINFKWVDDFFVTRLPHQQSTEADLSI